MRRQGCKRITGGGDRPMRSPQTLIQSTPLPQCPPPPPRTCVGHVLHLEIKGVEQLAACGGALGERAAQEGPACRLQNSSMAVQQEGIGRFEGLQLAESDAVSLA